MTSLLASAPGHAGGWPGADAQRRRGTLLVAHGSRDRRAAGVVAELAAAVRRELADADPAVQPGPHRVAVAHLDFTEPSVGAALRGLADEGVDEVSVVPLLFAPGYHVRVDLPAAVAEARAGRPALAVTIAEPLGTDPGPTEPDLLLDALEARLTASSGRYDAVVLASAGSSDPLSRNEIEAMGRRWSARSGQPVVAAYATAAEPTVADAIGRLRAQGAVRVAVSGLFIAPGRLPDAVRRAAESAGAAVVAEPLGADPALVRLVSRRAIRVKAHSALTH